VSWGIATRAFTFRAPEKEANIPAEKEEGHVKSSTAVTNSTAANRLRLANLPGKSVTALSGNNYCESGGFCPASPFEAFLAFLNN
jgi:hypothetical protein